jgi:hypothetical protein
MKKISILISTISVFLIFPITVFAHQPQIVRSHDVYVVDPEVSKAYYATLYDQSDTYHITSDKAFNLYVNILVPDIAGQKKDVTATVFNSSDITRPIAVLGGPDADWQPFFEPFGHDRYWQGPEYRMRVEAGSYEVHVSSSMNDSKYSLAIGEIESFNFSESLNALSVIPQLKRDFFNTSPADFIFSSMGWGFILGLFVLSWLFGFTYRALLKKFAKPGGVRKRPRNIGKADRVLRPGLGVTLLILAITTTWSPLLIFAAGFCFFESLFSWCGFYAAIGRDTCPL